MNKKNRVPAPDAGARYYSDVILCCIPVMIMSVFFYGLRPLFLSFAAVVTGNLIDRLMAFLRDRTSIPANALRWCWR